MEEGGGRREGITCFLAVVAAPAPKDAGAMYHMPPVPEMGDRVIWEGWVSDGHLCACVNFGAVDCRNVLENVVCLRIGHSTIEVTSTNNSYYGGLRASLLLLHRAAAPCPRHPATPKPLNDLDTGSFNKVFMRKKLVQVKKLKRTDSNLH